MSNERAGTLILIADDNPRMRQTIRSLIRDLADEILECGDGASAVEIYRARVPDLVVMDITMPGMDGIEATRRIRAAHPSARIVIVSDFCDGHFREAALRAGAIALIDKEDLSDLQSAELWWWRADVYLGTRF